MKGSGKLLCVGVCLVPIASSASARDEHPLTRATLARVESLPLHFEPNHGQADGAVKFLAHGTGYGLQLRPVGVALALEAPTTHAETSFDPARAVPPSSAAHSAVVRITLVGADPKARARGEEPLPGRSHYLIGNDPSRWQTDVPQYARVRYSDVYPRTDVVFYGQQKQLEYDIVVKRGGDPGRVRIRFEGEVTRVRLDHAGNLIIETPAGNLIQRAPVLYQETAVARRNIAGRYVITAGHEVRLEVADYDRSAALIIDPVLAFSTYLGGGGNNDLPLGVEIDGAGNIYVAGYTNSPDFPSKNPVQASHAGGTDVFVTKLDPTASSIVYSTYLGGVGADSPFQLAIDAAGAAYVVGYTRSVNFPTVNALQATFGGDYDGFVAKLSPSGSTLLYSTFFGGTGHDDIEGIALDGLGEMYCVGSTNSPSLPGVTPSLFGLNPTMCSGQPCVDGFVLKLSNSGSSARYFTYLGGSGGDLPRDVAVDPLGSVYVVGGTSSTDFPTRNALQPSRGALGDDAFVSKINPGGTALIFSTYLGGSGGAGPEEATGIALDTSNNIYLTGRTPCRDFPTTAGVIQRTLGGTADAFVAKLDSSGSQLLYSTLLGGSDLEYPSRLRVDSGGNAYVTGFTLSPDFPSVNPLQGYGGGTCFGEACQDAFVAIVNPDASALLFSTHLGGSSWDVGRDIAIQPDGGVVAVGDTGSMDFPTRNALDNSLAGLGDGFIVKIDRPMALGPLRAFTLAPCRVIDTREPNGLLAGPVLFPSEQRQFTISGACGVPASAQAVLGNLTVVLPSAAGFLTVFPANSTRPSTSSINFSAGQVRANAGVFRLDGTGSLRVVNGSAGTTHFLLDVTGYFE